MMIKYIILFFSLLISFNIISQAPSKFYQRWGGNGYDVGYNVKQTLDSGYIVAGSTSSFGAGNTDMYLAKLDKMGQLKFQKAFGNYNNENAKSVIQLIDSSYVMLGYTNSSGFGGYDIYLVKTDKNGILLWQKNFGGTDWDFGNSLIQTTDGNFIIAGTTYSYGRGNADGYIIKTDATGNVLWSKTYGGANDDEFNSVIQTADGGFALTGYSKSYADATNGDIWAFKLNSTGDSTWCKFYGGTKEDYGSCILELQNLNILVSGGTKSSSVGGNLETVLVTYSVSGLQVQNYVDVSSYDEYYNGVAQSSKGHIANCGATKNPVFNYDALVDIYDASYNYVNFFGKGDYQIEEFYSISKTFDKGFVAVGKTSSYGAILDDIFLMKIDSVGHYGVLYTGVKENEINKNEIGIYPNPTNNGFVNLKLPDSIDLNNLNYNLVDINGKVFYSNNLSKYNNHILLENISSGFYFIQIYRQNELIKTLKLSVINNN